MGDYSYNPGQILPNEGATLATSNHHINEGATLATSNHHINEGATLATSNHHINEGATLATSNRHINEGATLATSNHHINEGATLATSNHHINANAPDKCTALPSSLSLCCRDDSVMTQSEINPVHGKALSLLLSIIMSGVIHVGGSTLMTTLLDSSPDHRQISSLTNSEIRNKGRLIERAPSLAATYSWSKGSGGAAAANSASSMTEGVMGATGGMAASTA
ncbi:hypothetical protein CEUSTIGMA_g10334.t1 [Chlamydomonas eustigma]|uniref:Uncharacterized protein n=1 Tax=Chlamydomonas eustigma TaxID=1157962 RepID=A0A250XIJ9_9CHLO|nr:hypothetical protein CEUSTIGMA_g10334.t1 [Chlamydomonas eustigma]|eukprot:GAX82908.1 hypothetical protein CEUSTIGMA_g10334.t1 [Chlamydomonas eustigma]